MTRRERVLRAVEFKPTDQLPRDLGGMGSTGISCFAYPKLVEALGLPPRLPRVNDTSQMLALPDPDVLDALDCDCVTVFGDVTNAFEQPEKWKDYDFNGRLQARVRFPEEFTALPDGTLVQREVLRMPSDSYVFDYKHGGNNVDFVDTGDLGLLDLGKFRKEVEAQVLTKEEIRSIRETCERVRETTDRAIFFNGPGAGLSIGAHGGMGVFPIICTLYPDYAVEFNEIMSSQAAVKLEMLLSEIGDLIDIYMLSADDWGTQQSTIASPKVFKELFVPNYRKVTDTVHRFAPNVKAFLHSCGAIYDIIDDVIESGFDILNPVQWTAGGHTYQEWKDKARGRIALWGGGVNSQVTLPLGTVEEVEQEAFEVASYLAGDSRYVYCCIHNILAEIAPEKVIAMYRAA